MNNDHSQRLTVAWMFFAFAVWVFCFWGFLTNQYTLTSDALSYYDHTKFFIENLSSGIFPLWDPFWCNGAPNDFFLRRIGCFNPFYLIILIFKTIGIPYTLSYLWFLALYYGGGMIAFYLLMMRLYQNRLLAYSGFLLLLFSSLGTRLFDSYMMLITVPIIWFFYFLIAFSQSPKKHLFLGIGLSLMILAGTYIPFYFLIILTLFLVLFAIIYPKEIPSIFLVYQKFIQSNKVLVLLTLFIIAFSFLPIVNFYIDSAHGHVVMPIRHGNSTEGHTLAVSHQTLDWGIIEDFMYSSYFSDLRMFKFAVVYVPFFAFIVLSLGFMAAISRQAIFLFLLGSVLFCSMIPYGLPFYNFLYQHLFILKYFRNLHFFIWFFLIPLFVMLVIEHWHLFNQFKLKSIKDRWLLASYVLIVHLGIFTFVCWRHDATPSTFIMLALSLVFWILKIFDRLSRPSYALAFVTLIIIIQPLEAYHYLSLKSLTRQKPYDYDFSYSKLNMKFDYQPQTNKAPSLKEALYYAAQGYNYIYSNISDNALNKYTQNKFILVDNLEVVNEGQLDIPKLEQQFLEDQNKAVVYRIKAEDTPLNSHDPNPSSHAQHIDCVSQDFKILSFNANSLRLAIKLPYEKFLIYNDSYDPGWKVTVNHQARALYEVNGAFKGVWVPAGQSIIEFSYAQGWKMMMNVLLSIFAVLVLTMIIFYAVLSFRE